MNGRQAIAVAIGFSLLIARAAAAQTGPPCSPPTPFNVYFSWFGNVSGCSSSAQTSCRAGEPIKFYVWTYQYSFSACPHQFFWDFDDGSFSAEKDPVHVFLQSGKHRVTLRVVNSAGSIALDTTIDTGPIPTVVASVDEFTAFPPRVLRGNAVTLRWRVRSATAVRIDPLDVILPASVGLYTFTPSGTQRYTLTAFGDAAAASSSIVVEVVGRQRAARH